MDPQRLDVEAVFLQALEKDPAERQAFLDTTCADGKVRTRVAALLKAHDKPGSILDGPAVQLASLAGQQDPSAHPGAAPPPRPAQACAADHELFDFLDRCDKPGRLGMLAHYAILDVIGRGGMGVVLRGVDVKLNRVAAIKVLAPQLAANAVARQRFLREAQAAAAVCHPHVVTIHAVDEFKGLPYLVMEYVSASSLQQKIDGGPLQIAQILRIGTQIASGLAAAHAQGLVHRDIKPANILLENGNERVKITDFGLARSIDDVSITQSGVVYGTPLYMSPEQAQGERVDQRSDLFSLGSVMYAMSTGRPPFRGETGFAVLKRVCGDTPRPIREVNPNVPEALAAIVAKLLAKDPQARFQTAGEVAELLSRYLAQVEDDPHTPFQSAGPTQPLSVRNERPDGNDTTNGRPRRRAVRSRGRWPLLLGAAVLLLGAVMLAALEGARLTNWMRPAEPVEVSADKEAPAVPGTAPAVPHPSTRPAARASDRPVKVYILAGDSSMAGMAKITLLKYQANQAETKGQFQHLIRDGEWVVREDVWIKNFQQKGNLTVGFGQTPDRFGPELEFGNVVGDHFDEQVLLIKTCGSNGHSLCHDFRSPSAGPPPPQIVEQMLNDLRSNQGNATLADVEGGCGARYREMLTEVRETLAHLGEHFPNYQGQEFEIAGFVWFQGWVDMVVSIYNPVYAEHLGHFIRDVRHDLKAPNLPFVIGQMGVYGGSVPGTSEANIRAAQAAVAQLPEFRVNVRLVATDPFWDGEAHAVFQKGWKLHQEEWNKVGSDFPYHYLGSARTFCRIGKAFGEAMIELHRSSTRN